MSGFWHDVLLVLAVPLACWVAYMIWIGTGGRGGWGP